MRIDVRIGVAIVAKVAYYGVLLLILPIVTFKFLVTQAPEYNVWFNVLVSLIIPTLGLFSRSKYIRKSLADEWIKWFWDMRGKQQIIIVYSVLAPKELLKESTDEYTLYAPIGDIASLTLVRETLKRVYPKMNIESLTYPNDRSINTIFENRMIVSIGGGRNNLVSRNLRPKVQPPVYGRDENDPGYDVKYASNKDGSFRLTPTIVVREGKEILVEDYGYIIRTVNPDDKSSPLIFLIGAYTYGTYAAAKWATNSNNLRWLWWEWQKNRVFRELLRKKTDSIEIMFKVSVIGHEVGEPKLLSTSDIIRMGGEGKGIHSVMFFSCEEG